MLAKRTLSFLVALGLLAALPAVSEASFARRIGSSYGGTLSSNPSIRTQQLTADPVSVLRGSTSTEYDPSVVSLRNITAEPGFNVTEAYVGVTFDNGETEDLVSLGQFLGGLAFEAKQTGYLQVFYEAAGGSGPIGLLALDPGYVVVDKDGVTDADNTHTMLFDYLPDSNNVVAKYRLYADNGSRGTSPDFLVSFEDPSFTIRDIREANVEGALIPLPAAAGPGLVGLALVGLVKKFRRRRAVA